MGAVQGLPLQRKRRAPVDDHVEKVHRGLEKGGEQRMRAKAQFRFQATGWPRGEAGSCFRLCLTTEGPGYALPEWGGGRRAPS